jgi:hypothetical protein
MNASEAAKLLEIAPDATPEQLEARFLELRRKLEDKIAKAPTPGLQAKYRESLTQITTAFEFLTLAADSSALPVLNKPAAGSVAGVADPGIGTRTPPGSATPATARASDNQKPKPRNQKSGREFLIVALIAVAVLGAGGWFVMKSRAEAAERARIAAAEKAEHDRKVAEEHRLAEEARLAAEAEKARLAAAEKAEQQRLETLTGQLRGELAEYKIGWEAIEREERNAERRLGELKSDLRSLRDASPGQMAEAQANVAAQQSYSDWLGEILTQHPAKVARSKAEELLSARQPDAAQAALAEVKVAMAELNQSIRKTREQLLDLDGELQLRTDDDVSWTLSDAFGRTRSGRGSAQLDGIAVGYGRIQLTKPRWPAREEKFLIRRDQPVEVIAEHKSQTLKLRSNPAGAEVRLDDGKVLGTTPLTLEGFPPGTLTVSLSLEGYYDLQRKLTLPSPEADGPMLALKVKPTGLVKPDRWSSPPRVKVENTIAMTGSATSNTHLIEEWDLSQPNPNLGWTQITRKFVIYSGTNAQYAPVAGSIIRQQRQADGSWNGNFTQGGLADSSLNYIWERTAAALWQVHLGLLDVWPESEVVVGGTWAVKPAAFFQMTGLVNATGQVTAKLLALERQDDGDRAVIEFAYSYTIGGMNGQATLKAFVNLTEGYVTRTEGRDTLNTGTSTIYNNYSTTVTKR